MPATKVEDLEQTSLPAKREQYATPSVNSQELQLIVQGGSPGSVDSGGEQPIGFSG